MTTPHQRTQAVLQTREFLLKVISGEAWSKVPLSVQNEARRLLFHYPEPWHLSRLHEQVPDDWGIAAAAADGPIRGDGN